MKQIHCALHWAYLITAICFSLSSCYYGPIIPDPYIVDETRQKENTYYVPSAPNVPLLREKNDLSFSAMRASGSKFTGVEIQAACLPWKHVGISGSYSGGKNKPDPSSDFSGPNYMEYNRFEIGAGYVTQLAKGWHFETYAGMGNGKIRNWHHTGTSTINLTHFFLQPAISVSDKEQTIQFGLSSRFAGVTLNVVDTLFNTEREPFSHNQVKSLYDQSFQVMWEPALVLRAGWRNFLFNTQLTYSADISNSELYRSKINFSAGVLFRFNTKMK